MGKTIKKSGRADKQRESSVNNKLSDFKKEIMPRRTSAVAESLVDVAVDDRATRAVANLGLTREQVQVTLELALSQSYEVAVRQEALDMLPSKRKVEIAPETVREWTKDPNFVLAVGWCVIGFADNHED